MSAYSTPFARRKTLNASVGEIAVLTDACQLFAAACVLIFLLLVLTALVSSLKPRCSDRAKRPLRADHVSKSCGVTHLAVIMDGNRRYGRSHVGVSPPSVDGQQADDLTVLCGTVVYGNGHLPEPLLSPGLDTVPSPPRCAAAACAGEESNGLATLCRLIRGTPMDGHRCGGEKLLEFIQYAIDAGIPMLTVYAFSTDNWHRPEREVNVLMSLFFFFFQRVRAAARQEGMFIRFVSTRPDLIPPRILALMMAIECETRLLPRRRIVVNICVSYSGQTEIASASTRVLQRRWLRGDISTPVTPEELRAEMLRSLTQDEHESEDLGVFTAAVPQEPQLIMRTSGEQRLSNFLSFESAYSELFFLDKTWPEVNRDDLDAALESYRTRDIRIGR